MTTAKVTTQQELDAALASGANTIHIESPAGVWLKISQSGSARVEASGSARVVASGSARVVASDSARVEASGSARVVASDSARVEASGSARVEASGSASVEASGSASVEAYDSASVVASPYVAVHLRSVSATVSGGVLIDITQLDLTDPKVWAEYHGVKVERDGDTAMAVLYKAAGPELVAGADYDKPTTYEPGTTVTAPDWRDDHDCGGGLHISPRPAQAKRYRYRETGTRFLRVTAPLADLRPIDATKCKTPTVRVLAEVDVHGAELATAGQEVSL